jgi:hypothetical protein
VNGRSPLLRAALAAALTFVAVPASAATGDIVPEQPAPAEPGMIELGPLGGQNADRPLPEHGVVPGAVVHRDLHDLPAAVAETRLKLMAAAATGDVEALRAIIEAQSNPPSVTLGGQEDPIGFLRSSSNDGAGRELLGILLELLEAPYAVLGEGGDNEVFIWPYLAVVSLRDLTPPELVELYKLVSFYDYQDMLDFGGWYFFRVGILANGEWSFFLAGD